MGSDIKLLDLITNYIVRRKGKQLRPMLVFLSAGACGQINQSTYVAAGMIELLHTATLVHDDVVDEPMNGGFFNKCPMAFKGSSIVGIYLSRVTGCY